MRCRACGGPCETVYVMDPMPLAGGFALTAEDALAMERRPLEWRWCHVCGLVNAWPDVPDADIYDAYSYHASDVPALRRHHEHFAEWLARHWQPRLHIEIGGNDGVLTKHLPWPSINIDPSDAWLGPGHNEPFTLALARTLPTADLVTSSNAFAHFSGIGEALDGVREVLAPGGVFVVEVHDLDATLATNQWDTCYHEHKVEWDAHSLEAAGARHGLVLIHLMRLPLHGGLLRATFQAGDVKPPEPVRPDFSGLQRAYDEATAHHLPDGAVAYGAAARATVYLDHVRPNVEAVIDGSPRRQGRYVPGLGLPILPPEDFGDPPAALITAFGHEEDIMANHPGYHRWVTR